MYARLYACIPELALLSLQPDEGSLDHLLSSGNNTQSMVSRCISFMMMRGVALVLVDVLGACHVQAFHMLPCAVVTTWNHRPVWWHAASCCRVAYIPDLQRLIAAPSWF